jgi:hypothetical protein
VSDPTPNELPQRPPCDPFLHALVKAVEDVWPTGSSLDVTLWLPGGVVTGQLISKRHFSHLFAQSFGGALGQVSAELGADVERGLREVADTVHADRKEQEQRDPQSLEERQHLFVHLSGARMLLGSAMAPQGGMLWRARVDQIAAFSFGELTLTPPA